MNEIDIKLSLKYAQLREDLIEQNLFEELDNSDETDERFLNNLSRLQEDLTEKGVSQQSIDTVVETIWLLVQLGVKDKNAIPRVRAAFEEICSF